MSYSWSEVYEYACKAFGQTPRPEDEAAILEHFEQNPLHVLREIDRIATALHEGKVRYAWSAFAGRLKQEPAQPLREAIVDGGPERERRIRNTERWIHNAGIHYDREEDVLAELFGDGGRFKDHRDDFALRERLLAYWHEQRPRGIQAEADHEAWNAKCKIDRAITLQRKHLERQRERNSL